MKKGMDLDQRRRNLLKTRNVVVDKCREKDCNPEACKIEVEILGLIAFRLARLQDEEIESSIPEEKEDKVCAGLRLD
jgi:hypothetical protein